MLSLKQRYEVAVKDRNSVGIHLLDRNDELCILYERLNIQQEVLKKGETALQEREEEIRKLNLVKSELCRQIELQKNLIPKTVETNNKVKKLESELESIRKTVTELSIKMESPDDPNRSRHLKGKDLSRKQLIDKITKLENQMAEKEVIPMSILHLSLN